MQSRAPVFVTAPVPVASREHLPVRVQRIARAPPLYKRRSASPMMELQSPVAIANEARLTSIIQALRSSPVVLGIRQNDASVAYEAAAAALRGGLKCIEITLTTPNAIELIQRLRLEFPSACIGAGTVLSHRQITAVHQAGACFAMSPITDASIITACSVRGILPVPGAATPTECFTAHQHGARIVKVFPINLFGGIRFVKAMQGPLPNIPLLPTSGVGLESLSEYLSQSNVLAVGASRQLLPPEALRHKNWSAISCIAAQWASVAATASQP
ncbi:unnamed protein product [Agarophyton chilense]